MSSERWGISVIIPHWKKIREIVETHRPPLRRADIHSNPFIVFSKGLVKTILLNYWDPNSYALLAIAGLNCTYSKPSRLLLLGFYVRKRKNRPRNYNITDHLISCNQPLKKSILGVTKRWATFWLSGICEPLAFGSYLSFPSPFAWLWFSFICAKPSRIPWPRFTPSW